jgi:hypothetical protein
MVGGTVQMGRIQPACLSCPSNFGLVAHHGRTDVARAANGGASGGPVRSSLPTAGVVKEGH